MKQRLVPSFSDRAWFTDSGGGGGGGGGEGGGASLAASRVTSCLQIGPAIVLSYCPLNGQLQMRRHWFVCCCHRDNPRCDHGLCGKPQRYMHLARWYRKLTCTPISSYFQLMTAYSQSTVDNPVGLFTVRNKCILTHSMDGFDCTFLQIKGCSRCDYTH